VYKAVLTLTAKSGFTFSDVGVDSFVYTGATSVTNAAGNGTTISVTITFPATAADPGTDPGTGLVKIEFTGLPQDETITLNQTQGTISWKANTTLTASVSGNFEAYRWALGGVTLEGKTTVTLTLNAKDLSVRRHRLTVFIEKNGIEYAKQVDFTVQP
jgi:hypothetical protein